MRFVVVAVIIVIIIISIPPFPTKMVTESQGGLWVSEREKRGLLYWSQQHRRSRVRGRRETVCNQLPACTAAWLVGWMLWTYPTCSSDRKHKLAYMLTACSFEPNSKSAICNTTLKSSHFPFRVSCQHLYSQQRLSPADELSEHFFNGRCHCILSGLAAPCVYPHSPWRWRLQCKPKNGTGWTYDAAISLKSKVTH
jgi:transposase InsO family protein